MRTTTEKVSKEERKKVQLILGQYRYMKKVIQDFEKHESSNEDREPTCHLVDEYNRNIRIVGYLERAMEFIEDEESRGICEQRYFKGFTSKELIYRHPYIHESTILRKLNKGIEDMTRMLKLWGVLDE